MSSVSLSVVVPIYNEEASLWSMAEGLAPLLDDLVGAGRWQFVLVDNGSRDRTPLLVKKIQERWPTALALRLPRPDYGEALAAGLAACQGRWAYVINVDHWDPVFCRWAWRMRERYDLILGSKRCDPSLNQQSRYRRTLSWGLNALLQFVFGYVGTDTHGQKLLRLESMTPILRQCRLRRGQFDTEFTLRAMRAGLWLAEAPVPLVEQRRPRNLMVKKVLQNLYDILRLRRVMKEVPRRGPIRYHRWAREDMLQEGGHGDEARAPGARAS